MAGSANPGFNPNMQSLSIPDVDDPQPLPSTDWGAPVPGPLNPIADALTGNPVAPGQPFVRVVSSAGGQADVLDPTVGVPGQ